MNKNTLTALAVLALANITNAQSSDITTLIRQAQDRSSLVKAAQAIVEARKANIAGVRSPSSPTLELSPGVGFTNSNTALSQEIDLSGRRGAATRLATLSLEAAELEVIDARAHVSRELLTSLARLLAAREEVESSIATVEAAKALLVAVSKQHEIGEAPQVHVTRAELDVLRAGQHLAQAEGRRRSAQASLDSLSGNPLELEGVIWPAVKSELGRGRSIELLRAGVELAYTEAQSRVARADFAPILSAGIASDIWSLNRNRFNGDNIGLQLSFRIPLFDAGKRKGTVRAADLEIKAAQARLDEARRVATLRLTEAIAVYEPAKSVALSFEGDVLPKGESMLTAMRGGYSTGLVTLVEVLEAQQTVSKLRQERIQATLGLRLAEVELWRAQLVLPGVEVPR